MQAVPSSVSTGLCRAIAGGVLLAALGACGYKGPLYLPPPPPPDEQLAAPPTPQALPEESAGTPSAGLNTAPPAAK